MKKRILCIILTVIVMLSAAGCSNPKRDARDTNVQEQMENRTLDISQ